MYLTAGQFKHRKIEVPPNTRPTLSKVREGIFNILSCFDYKREKPLFFEMFAGSGIMGLEAISRGYCSFGCEINQKTIKIINKNYKNLDLKSNIIKCDAMKYKTDLKFDIVYIDPPWDYNYTPIIKKARELIDDNGIVIIEYDKTRNIDIENILLQSNTGFKSIKQKQYGRTLINFLMLM